MKFELYNDINKYINDVMDVLVQHEIQNNLLISNCLRGKAGMDTANWFMGVVKDAGGAVQLAALMTPPHNIVVYESNNTPNDEAVKLLIDEIIDLKIPIPGILAEKSLAERFAGSYLSASATNKKAGVKMRIYRLDNVNDITEAPGRFRAAEEKDLFYLPYWNIAFNQDCGHNGFDVQGSLERVKRLLNEKTLYIWEDGIPVSQAAIGRRTLNGAVVNAVYTPPHYRGKGYATSCVARLSRHALDSGYKFCSLFTNLANPISNSIYMKIGYKPVCDYDEYLFEVVRE